MKRKNFHASMPVVVLVVTLLGQGCDRQDASQTCSYMGQEYESGEAFPNADGCNSCMCDPNGDTPGEYECTGVFCCSLCTEGQLCVANYNTSCVLTVFDCVDTDCNGTCSAECDVELCGSPSSCATESCPVMDGAFGCFDP